MQNQEIPKPTRQVAARVEELLREQLMESGVDPRRLTPEQIAKDMLCTLAPDGSMTYAWQGTPILHITPERRERDGERSVLWRMFTKDDMPPVPEAKQ